MRLDDYRTSDNVGEQRGGGFGGGGGGLGGGAMGLILGSVASRFGIGGVLVLIAGAWLLGYSPFGGGSGVVSPGTQVAPAGGQQRGAGLRGGPDAAVHLPGSRQHGRYLGDGFQGAGAAVPAGRARLLHGQRPLRLRRGAVGDGTVLLPDRQQDLYRCEFLRTSFRIASERPEISRKPMLLLMKSVHHIQFLTGTLEQANTAQQRLSKAEGNAVQVRVELQADCYAGVWAARNRARLEQGDVEEGMRAAEAIGDDTLQRKGQGRVVPESFTHGSSAQRMAWLRKGLQTGDPRACDTFNGAV
jgi:predicted metalloprotease